MDDAAKLMEEAAQARRQDRLDDAYRAYAKAAAICRERGDPRGLIHALKGTGQIERDRGNLEAALAAYQEAAALAREESDPLLLAHTVRHAGDVLRHLGRFTDADDCCTEALAIYRSRPDAPALDLANAIRSVAVLKESMGATDQALPLWEEAHQIYSSLGVQAGVAESKARQAKIGGGNQR